MNLSMVGVFNLILGTTIYNSNYQVYINISALDITVKSIKMRIYELIQCELDENNHNYNDKRVGFFMTAQNVYDYLTQDGHSHDEISILNHTDKSRKYIESAIERPNAIIKLHTECFDNPLLGVTSPSYDTYY